VKEGRDMNHKIPLCAVILTFGLFAGCIQSDSPNIAFGQFYEEPETNGTNSFNSSNSTQPSNPTVADIVLLSQKLKKASSIDTYRHVIGQVKNIGNEPATLVRADLTIYDKNGNLLGTAWSYVTGDILNPNQKSTFDMGSPKEDFKGMDHYELSLKWKNPDGSQGYKENAQIYKSNSTEAKD
jgi:hypothetical protein